MAAMVKSGQSLQSIKVPVRRQPKSRPLITALQRREKCVHTCVCVSVVGPWLSWLEEVAVLSWLMMWLSFCVMICMCVCVCVCVYVCTGGFTEPPPYINTWCFVGRLCSRDPLQLSSFNREQMEQKRRNVAREGNMRPSFYIYAL